MSKLDAEIDLAVREMLDVEAPAGLRGRVLDRIDALSTNSVLSTDSVVSAFRRNTRNNWWLAAPLATAAVIVLAVLAPWRPTAWRQTAPQEGPSGPASIAHVKPAPVLPPGATQTSQPVRSASKPPSTLPPRALPSPRGIEEHLVVAAVVAAADDNTRIEPLAPIPLITVAGTHPSDITQKEIAISPLAPIAELQTGPLSPPEWRN